MTCLTTLDILMDGQNNEIIKHSIISRSLLMGQYHLGGGF